jgi:hypothetical protein
LTYADVDGDGHRDVVAATYDKGIVWFRDRNGMGDFQPLRRLVGDVTMTHSVDTGDLDGDGDLDLIVAATDRELGQYLVWYENPGDQGPFSRRDVLISNEGFAEKLSLRVVDLDSDGDPDVVAQMLHLDFDPGERYPSIFWFENQSGLADFSSLKTIVDDLPVDQMQLADLDGDGDLDVIRSSSWAFYSPTVAWYENLDGGATFGAERPLLSGSSYFESVVAGDLDSDGDLDLIGSTGLLVQWLENVNGRGDFAMPRTIGPGGWNTSLSLADLDGDNQLDVVAGSGEVTWYRNQVNGESFAAPVQLASNINGYFLVKSHDLDGDGDDDILASVSGNVNDRVVLLENLDGRAMFSQEQPLTSTTTGVNALWAADLDGDGDSDLISAPDGGGNVLAWYENTDSSGTFSDARIIARDANLITSAIVADIDHDQDADILVSSYDDDRIAVYRNLDGRGNFGAAEIVSNLANGATAVFAADLDGDNDLDLISASWYAVTVAQRDNLVAWYENLDGNGRFGAARTISTSLDGVQTLFAGDIDNDGDTDVLTGSRLDNTIAWFENLDGSGSFGVAHEIVRQQIAVNRIVAADLDQDGDLDVVASSADDRGASDASTVVWHENLGGTAWSGPHTIVAKAGARFNDIAVDDLDRDGDLDVVAAAAGVHQLEWYENLDGRGGLGGQQHVIARIGGSVRVAIANINADECLDVIASAADGGGVLWFEQRILGDVNGDGRFDSSDLVSLFQTGHYEDQQAGNSGFLEGDWNGDGDFDSADLTLAFQAGQYEL